MFDFRKLAGMGKKGYEACVTAVAEATVNAEASAQAHGNYYDGKRGWIGLQLDSASATAAGVARADGYTKLIFTPVPLVELILGNWAHGMLGQPYIASVINDLSDETETTEQKELLDLENILREWRAVRDSTIPMMKAIESSLWGGDTMARTDGRGIVRYRIPPAFLEDGKMVRSFDFNEAMSISRLEFLDPSTAIVLDLADAMQEGSIHLYTVGEKEMVEYSYIDAVKTKTADGGSETVLVTRIFQMDKDGKMENPKGWELLLNGRLLTFQITHKLLIGDPMIQLQKAANLAMTAQMSNQNLAGWVEREVMNSIPPGHWEENADGSKKLDSNGRPIYTIDEQIRGETTVQYIQGIPIKDGDGNITGITQPSTKRIDPVTPKTFNETIAVITAIMLRMAGQSHLNMASGNSSGVALTFQRRSYYIELSSSRTQVNSMLKWALETAVAMAGLISKDNTYSAIRINARVVLDTGVITAGEVKTLAEIWKLGFLSWQTLVESAGFEPTLELGKMVQEQARKDADVLPDAVTGKAITKNVDGDDAADETDEVDDDDAAGDDAE